MDNAQTEVSVLVSQLRTVMTENWFRDLGESWFWLRVEDARRLAKRGDPKAALVLIEADAKWRAYRQGLRRTLTFPGCKGHPHSDVHAAVLVAAWLAGIAAIPPLGRNLKALCPRVISQVMRLAAEERWANSTVWEVLSDENYLRCTLWRHRLREDLVVVLPPA